MTNFSPLWVAEGAAENKEAEVSNCFFASEIRTKQLCFSFLFRDRYLSPGIALQRKSCLPSWFSLGFIWQVILANYQRPCAWQTEIATLLFFDKGVWATKVYLFGYFNQWFQKKKTFLCTSNQFSALIALRILIVAHIHIWICVKLLQRSYNIVRLNQLEAMPEPSKTSCERFAKFASSTW